MIPTGSKAAALALFAIAATVLLDPRPSRADDESAMIGDVSVENVAATPARAGETSRITFAVENAGLQTVTLTGLRLPSGEPARVMGFLGHAGHTGEIGSVRIGPGETSQLDGKNLWIEIGPLKDGLAPGSVVAARLLLGPYEAPVSIHVSRKNG